MFHCSTKTIEHRGPVQNRCSGPSFALNQYLKRETVSRQKGNLETDLVVKFIGNSKVWKRTRSSCMVLVEETRTLKTYIISPLLLISS